MSLMENTRWIRCLAPSATGTAAATQAGSIIDTGGFKGAMFFSVNAFTTLTHTLILEGADTTVATDFTTLASGTMSSTAQGRIVFIDVPRSNKPFLRPALTHTTGTTAIHGGVWCVLYDPIAGPTTHQTDITGVILPNVT